MRRRRRARCNRSISAVVARQHRVGESGDSHGRRVAVRADSGSPELYGCVARARRRRTVERARSRAGPQAPTVRAPADSALCTEAIIARDAPSCTTHTSRADKADATAIELNTLPAMPAWACTMRCNPPPSASAPAVLPGSARHRCASACSSSRSSDPRRQQLQHKVGGCARVGLGTWPLQVERRSMRRIGAARWGWRISPVGRSESVSISMSRTTTNATSCTWAWKPDDQLPLPARAGPGPPRPDEVGRPCRRGSAAAWPAHLVPQEDLRPPGTPGRASRNQLEAASATRPPPTSLGDSSTLRAYESESSQQASTAPAEQ